MPAQTGPTASGAPKTSPSGLPTGPPGSPVRWAVGLLGTWIALTILVDLGDTAELGAGLAVLIATSSVLVYGVPALAQLGFITSSSSST